MMTDKRSCWEWLPPPCISCATTVAALSHLDLCKPHDQVKKNWYYSGPGLFWIILIYSGLFWILFWILFWTSCPSVNSIFSEIESCSSVNVTFIYLYLMRMIVIGLIVEGASLVRGCHENCTISDQGLIRLATNENMHIEKFRDRFKVLNRGNGMVCYKFKCDSNQPVLPNIELEQIIIKITT